MVQRICPICDQKMNAPKYCKTCRRMIKQPYLRDVTYYLNERHPDSEAECSYHQNNKTQGDYKMPEWPVQQGRAVRQAQTSPVQLANNQAGGLDRPRPVTMAGWKPATQNGIDRGVNKTKWFGSGLVALVIISIMIFRMISAFQEQLPYENSRELLSSLLDQTDEDDSDYFTDGMFAEYEELDEADVIAEGQPCTLNGHFPIHGVDVETRLRQFIMESDVIIKSEDAYSYNERYDDGETWFCSYVVYMMESEDEESYESISVDFDTGTGALHGVDIAFADPAVAIEFTVNILGFLQESGAVDVDMEEVEAMNAELKEAFEAGEDYQGTLDYCYVDGYIFDDCYNVYISHAGDE